MKKKYLQIQFLWQNYTFSAVWWLCSKSEVILSSSSLIAYCYCYEHFFISPILIYSFHNIPHTYFRTVSLLPDWIFVIFYLLTFTWIHRFLIPEFPTSDASSFFWRWIPNNIHILKKVWSTVVLTTLGWFLDDFGITLWWLLDDFEMISGWLWNDFGMTPEWLRVDFSIGWCQTVLSELIGCFSFLNEIMNL